MLSQPPPSKKEINSFPSLLADANGEDPQASLYVGKCYFFGRVVKKDFKEAQRYFLISSKHGDRMGMFFYSRVSFLLGDSGAFATLEKLADDGLPPALFYVGKMYLDGENTGKDVQKTVALWGRAARLGHVPSSVLLAKLKFRISPSWKRPVLAIQLIFIYIRAAFKTLLGELGDNYTT